MNLEHCQKLDNKELKEKILDLKKKFGKKLLILAHCYQQDSIVELADFVGDSFALASFGAKNKDAENIIFCGVKFMAESSAILAHENQKVFLPDMSAGCPLADWADIDQVEDVWKVLEEKGIAKDITPITYMNSSAELKAFCGRNNGLVCTSSNAKNAFDWALKQRPKIFFFPDENLGRNTANAKNISKKDMIVIPVKGLYHDILSSSGLTRGSKLKQMDYPIKLGNDKNDNYDATKVILWKGFCHVHTFFSLDYIKEIREKYPDCIIAVHPECNEHVVNASDANGSTAFLKKFVQDAKPGLTLVIGTEINMVQRLAKENPDKKIIPLARSLCPNMFKTSLSDLCFVLESLPKENKISVPKQVKEHAKLALDRMLKL